ncbi:helix-turn-helix domain-containing protein [Streptomyces albiflavescens]|uniref:helix-turn-helix domain-containing protein n=1 Tax=Streptomyces albiflavescens TaxID=1623582 RepID=UPI001E634CE9|nr:helix-turn-helix domain-containing protein [Streptomyces albiflavescens]
MFTQPVGQGRSVAAGQKVKRPAGLAVDEARLQLGRSAVYDLLRTGQLASITLGRARRIPTHALTDFIHTRLEQEAA